MAWMRALAYVRNQSSSNPGYPYFFAGTRIGTLAVNGMGYG